ncbi:MAG: hypothetical protein ACPG5P_07995 [Saprospiraceae bacterium]
MSKQVKEKLDKKYIIAIRTNLSKLKFSEDDKKAMVYDFTDGRTTSIREMTQKEAMLLLNSFGQSNKTKSDKSNQKMIRKIYGICHDLGWQIEVDGTMKVDSRRMWGFVKKCGFEENSFDRINRRGLVKIITGLEQVLKDTNR